MTQRTRIVSAAAFAATVALAAMPAAIAGQGGNTVFNVYSADGSPTSGEKVTVTQKTSAPGTQASVESCTKPNPDLCNGTLGTYSRSGAGEPWYKQ